MKDTQHNTQNAALNVDLFSIIFFSNTISIKTFMEFACQIVCSVQYASNK